MILAQIEEFVSRNKRVALIDLAHVLDTEPEALRGMLRVLERKGRVRKLPDGTECGGGCTKCAIGSIEIFEWTG